MLVHRIGIIRAVAAGVLGLSISASSGRAQRTTLPVRVLLLFQQQGESQPMRELTQRLEQTLRDDLATPVEFYEEALDLDRFSERGRSSSLVHYFADKYRGFGLDVVVPVGVRALGFALDRLNEVFPGAPIVFALGAAPQLDPGELPSNVTGRVGAASRFAPTLSMAHRLQPDAERVVVGAGAGPADSASAAVALAGAADLHESLPLEVLQGLSLNATLGKLRQLSPRSIVIFANFREDASGEAFEPLDIVGSMARASAAPMYTQLRSYLGEGVVGGSVISFGDEGAATARLIARVLRRRPGEPMPPVETIPMTSVVDWRQLHRWGLAEASLPADTEILFREPTVWQRYRDVVLLTLGLIAAEALLIGLLLFERRRRILAQLVASEQERSAEEARRQIAHMGRVALVGELAATLSHELKQPLAAIRANAETGTLLLARPAADPSEAREIFQNIIDDDVRAVEVIEDVRRLLRKDKTGVKSVDLNEICRHAVRLLRHDASRRNVRLELSLAPSPPIVVGHPVELQQVILNLAINGLDAASTSSSERSVRVRTESAADHAEVVVHDSGPGFPPAVHARLFESFFSTKAAGLGLGLVIVRSIVERHNGRISAANHLMGGAVVRVRLPASSAVAENGPRAGVERGPECEPGRQLNEQSPVQATASPLVRSLPV